MTRPYAVARRAPGAHVGEPPLLLIGVPLNAHHPGRAALGNRPQCDGGARAAQRAQPGTRGAGPVYGPAESGRPNSCTQYTP